MSDQINFFDSDADSVEKQTYVAIIKPALDEVIAKTDSSGDLLAFNEGVNFSSVYYGASLVCRIYQRKKANYITFSSMGGSPTKIDLSAAASEYIPALQRMLEEMIWNYSADFGCCSHYVECSDALRCIQQDRLLSMSCQYKRNLYHGKVFYGKNKNIK